MKLKQLNEKVERFENLEEKCGIEIKSISFIQSEDGDIMTCYVEVYGDNLKKRVEINVIIYDTDGDIIKDDNRFIFPHSFNGFDVMRFIFFEVYINNISKIRIYPTT